MTTTPAPQPPFTTYTAGTILVDPSGSRFKVLEDGRLRLQGTGRWVASRQSVEENYGPLQPETK